MCLCYKRNRYNRLLAISQNGYVSHYWYDADGERDKRTVPVSHSDTNYRNGVVDVLFDDFW